MDINAEDIFINTSSLNTPELLAPAGSLAAGIAAFRGGADAIYVGLQKFSARASAENFTSEDLNHITAYARSLSPLRKVYLALNTIIGQREFPELAKILSLAAETKVDGLIVQDLGVAAFARRHVDIPLHASTQLAIHNLNGMRMLERLGFKRAILARELTLAEITEITNESALECEVFVHGSLCYSISGCCLFSGLLHGLKHSSNRGGCRYPCREGFCLENTKAKHDFPLLFSMKDLNLSSIVDELIEANITTFKIEGRKKPPLWVEAVSRHYRHLIDHSYPNEDARNQAESDLSTLFGRRPTTLYFLSADNIDVIDPGLSGNLGQPVGVVSRVYRHSNKNYLVTTLKRALELHDGLQFFLPGFVEGKGFPVLELRQENASKTSVPAEVEIAICLPEPLSLPPVGTELFLTCSQQVLRQFPQPGIRLPHHRRNLDVTISISPNAVWAEGIIAAGHPLSSQAVVKVSLPSEFGFAKSNEQGYEQAYRAFSRLGDTQFNLGELKIPSPVPFLPVSHWTKLRRRLTDAAYVHLEAAKADFQAKLIDDFQRSQIPHDKIKRPEIQSVIQPELKYTDLRVERRQQKHPHWILHIDNISNLLSFQKEDIEWVDELIIDLPDRSFMANKFDNFRKSLENLQARLSLTNEQIRLAPPFLVRGFLSASYYSYLSNFAEKGYRNLLVGNLWMIEMARDLEFNWAADWQLYVANTETASKLKDLGAVWATFSPEEDIAQAARVAKMTDLPLVVFALADIPQFVSVTCPLRQRFNCLQVCRENRSHDYYLTHQDGRDYFLTRANGVTYLLKREPQRLCGQPLDWYQIGIEKFRVDLRLRQYSPAQTIKIWHSILGTTPS